jgi:hypothetical protein
MSRGSRPLDALRALARVAHLEVRVAVVRVAYIGTSPEKRVRLVEEEDKGRDIRCAEQPLECGLEHNEARLMRPAQLRPAQLRYTRARRRLPKLAKPRLDRTTIAPESPKGQKCLHT